MAEQDIPLPDESNVIRDKSGRVIRYIATESNPTPLIDIKTKRALWDQSQIEKIDQLAAMKEERVEHYKQNPKSFRLCTDKKYPMNGYLQSNLDEIAVFIKKKYDAVIIVSGNGKVRLGKTLTEDTKIKIVDDMGNVIDSKPLGEYKDKEIINTISWDFQNDKQVFSKSEIIKEKDKKRFYKVKLSDGRIIKCSEDHRLFVKRIISDTNDKKVSKIFELPLREIKKGDKLVCLK